MATLDDWVQDAIAVLDAAGAEAATVIGSTETATIAMLLAAVHPERVRRLVLINSSARAIASDGYPIGYPEEVVDALVEAATQIDAAAEGFDPVLLAAPSAADDPGFLRWWQRAGRLGASPAVARAFLRLTVKSDLRAVLPTITAPSLVLHRAACAVVPLSDGRFVADHLPQATFVELPGTDELWWVGDTAQLLDQVESFFTGGVRGASSATIMFSDIVGCTELVAELGDAQWRLLLDRHDGMVRRHLERYSGTEVKTTGDGFLMTFEGPGRARECAMAIRDGAVHLAIAVHIGIHTGEVEARAHDIAGLNVHIAARVAACADAGEILASPPAVDLLQGPPVSISDRGVRDLKGVAQPLRLYALA